MVDLIHLLNEEFPRTKNAERKIGLYIEVKDWQWNIDYTGDNQADMLHELLVKNELDTIDNCKDDIPIVIQSFELEALEYYSHLSDLPRTLVMGIDQSSSLMQLWAWIESFFLLKPDPYIERGFLPDWLELSKVVSGIAPYHHLITKRGAPLDPMTEIWDRSQVDNKYSDLIALLHSLDIAVHPWAIKDDRL